MTVLSTFVVLLTTGIAEFLVSTYEYFGLFLMLAPLDGMINAASVFWINLPALIRMRKDSIDYSERKNGVHTSVFSTTRGPRAISGPSETPRSMRNAEDVVFL